MIVRACTSTAANRRRIPRDNWMIPRTGPSICSSRGQIIVRIYRAWGRAGKLSTMFTSKMAISEGGLASSSLTRADMVIPPATP